MNSLSAARNKYPHVFLFSIGVGLALLSLILLHTPHVAAACSTLPTDKGTVTLSANVPSTGTYYIWSHNKAPATNNNGYYLQIDSNCGITVGDAVIPVNTWTWVNYQNGSTNSRISVSLTSGLHTFKLYGLDPSVLVDRLILTTDVNCVPTGNGANCLTGGTTTTTPSSPSSPTLSTSNTSQPTSGQLTIGTANSKSTKVLIDGHEVVDANGSSPVTLDTTKLSDGYHQITVVTTDKDGTQHFITKQIYVRNHLYWWQDAYNWLYKTLGYRKALTNFIVMATATLLFTGVALVIYLAWLHRLWRKLPGWSKLAPHLPKLPNWLPHRAEVSSKKAVSVSGAVVGSMSTRFFAGPVRVFGHTVPVTKRALATIISFGLIGGTLSVLSFAATPALAIDPASGSLSGVTKGTDASSASGYYIQFGTGATATPTPTPSPSPTPAPSCPAGQVGTPPNCTTPTTGVVPCGLTTAAEACWASHTGVPGYTEAQILAGQSNLTHVTSQATAPAGTTYSGGNLTVTTNGVTLNRIWLDGCISIRANNVTISNSLIHDTAQHGCQGGDNNAAGSSINDGGCSGGAGTNTGLSIIDSEVDAGQGSTDYTGIGAGHYHLTRVNMHGGTKAAWAGCNVVVEESYGHGLTPNAGGIHEDVIDADTSVYVTVTHSWLSAVGGAATTGAMIFNASYGVAHDGTVTNCFVQGGPGADMVFNTNQYNMKITGNAFSNVNGWGGTDFFYGFNAANTGNVWSGNYIPETGKTLHADGTQT